MNRSAPIMPAAPAWFSTTMGWPMFSDIFCVIMRSTTSSELPAASGTSMRIGFEG
jgi:hypothetical protein